MKGFIKAQVALFVLATAPAYANFQHIIVIVQENRTPDNLFYSLCLEGYSCGRGGGSGYDIKTSNWLNKEVTGGVTQPQPWSLGTHFDLGHTHQPDWLNMCDYLGSGCQMDGAALETCHPDGGVYPTCPANPQFLYVDNSTGTIDPYIFLATNYGWANYMFQSNQGPSFPAHQFLFGSTSAPNKQADADGTFVAENPESDDFSCAQLDAVALIDSSGDEFGKVKTCFDHQTVSDLLEANSVSWKYYAVGQTSYWVAPNVIAHICKPINAFCQGTEWTDHVDPTPSDVLTDIHNCNLAAVS